MKQQSLVEKMCEIQDVNDIVTYSILCAVEMESRLKAAANAKTYQFQIKVFRLPVMAFYYRYGFGWVRLFKGGVKWKDTRRHNLLFSERQGISKYVKIGKWWVVSALK